MQRSLLDLPYHKGVDRKSLCFDNQLFAWHRALGNGDCPFWATNIILVSLNYPFLTSRERFCAVLRERLQDPQHPLVLALIAEATDVASSPINAVELEWAHNSPESTEFLREEQAFKTVRKKLTTFFSLGGPARLASWTFSNGLKNFIHFLDSEDG